MNWKMSMKWFVNQSLKQEQASGHKGIYLFIYYNDKLFKLF